MNEEAQKSRASSPFPLTANVAQMLYWRAIVPRLLHASTSLPSIPPPLAGRRWHFSRSWRYEVLLMRAAGFRFCATHRSR